MPRHFDRTINYRELWDAFLYDDEPENAPAPPATPAVAIAAPAAEDLARQQIEAFIEKRRARHAKKMDQETPT